jgi:two-component system, LuxR family, sensor kinase FixL
VQVNKGALQNSGYTWEDLQQMILYDLAPDLSPKKFAELNQVLFSEQQEAIVFEISIQRKNASVYPAEVILSLSRAENPPVLLAIMQDISQRKQVEEELMAFAKRLERSNQELQSFAHIASHDLQEPLRKVQLFSSRIEEKYNSLLDENGKEYIHRMQTAVQRMQAMISDLLKYARLSATENLQLELVDLNTVLTEVIGDLEIQIEQVNGTIRFDQLPVIPANPIQMYQLFQNLLSNALKYHRPDQPPIVHITCRYMPKRIQIIVEDNGIGIPEDSRERIFGFFHRLHGRNEYEGNGIGLAICRKIMDNHAGTIHAENAKGDGTRFVVALPLSTLF